MNLGDLFTQWLRPSVCRALGPVKGKQICHGIQERPTVGRGWWDRVPRGGHSGSQGGRAHDMSPPAGAGRASGETGMEVRGAQRSRDPAVGLEQEVQGDLQLGEAGERKQGGGGEGWRDHLGPEASLRLL